MQKNGQDICRILLIFFRHYLISFTYPRKIKYSVEHQRPQINTRRKPIKIKGANGRRRGNLDFFLKRRRRRNPRIPHVQDKIIKRRRRNHPISQPSSIKSLTSPPPSPPHVKVKTRRGNPSPSNRPNNLKEIERGKNQIKRSESKKRRRSNRLGMIIKWRSAIAEIKSR